MAVSAVAGPLGIAVAIVVAVLPLERAALPEILVGPLGTAVAVAFGVANLGRPRFVASPNACSFPSPSSSAEPVGAVFAGSSTDALSNDDPGSHSSSLSVSLHKRTGHFDSRPNLSHSTVSDTSVHPTDATTSHCRKRCPRPRQGRRTHTSQEAQSKPVERQIRRAAAEQY